MSLVLSLRSELLKVKRTAALYFSGIVAALMPFGFLLEYMEVKNLKDLLADPWNRFYSEGMMGFCFAILPLYIILVSTLLPQIEYRNNTWKQVLSSPQPLASLFFSKYFTVQLMVLLLFVLYNLFMALSLLAIAFVSPDLHLFSLSFNWGQWLKDNAVAFGSVQAIIVIQFWIGLWSKSFITPIAIGVGLWLAGGMLIFEMHWPHADLYPYSHPYLVVLDNHKAKIPFVLGCSAVYTALMLLVAFAGFNRRRIRG
jgi:lantibiotic transport system permease protein